MLPATPRLLGIIGILLMSDVLHPPVSIGADDDYSPAEQQPEIAAAHAVLMRPPVQFAMRQGNVRLFLHGAMVNGKMHLDGTSFREILTQRQKSIDEHLEIRLKRIQEEYEFPENELEQLRLASRRDQIRYQHALALVTSSDGLKTIAEWEALIDELDPEPRNSLEKLSPSSYFERVSARLVAGKTPRPPTGEHATDFLSNRHWSNADAAVRNLARHVKLRDRQKMQLVKLLVDELPKPQQFGDFDDLIAQYQFARMPEDRLKPNFDDDQWPQVRRALDKSLEFEPFLRQHHLLPTEVPANPKAAIEKE